MTPEERPATPDSRRGLWLVGLVVLTILLGGGAALWSLLSAVTFTGAPGATATSPGASPEPTSSIKAATP